MKFCEIGLFCETQDDFVFVVSKYNFCILQTKETGKKERQKAGTTFHLFASGQRPRPLSLAMLDSSPKGRALGKTRKLPALPNPLTLIDFPRPGQILPAPGRNVTVGDKERNRCRVSDRKGNKVALRKQ